VDLFFVKITPHKNYSSLILTIIVLLRLPVKLSIVVAFGLSNQAGGNFYFDVGLSQKPLSGG